MTTELRAALADLASEAPTIDIAAGAIARGRARRRMVVAGIAAACAVAVIGATATVAALRTAPESPPSAPPAGHDITFAPDVVVNPWGWGEHDLPMTLDEPIAMLLTGYQTSHAVTESGRVFKLDAGAHTPAVTPDGTTVAWWNIDDQELVIRDLADGSEQRQPASISSNFDGVKTAFEKPMWWSEDGATLAVSGEDGSLTLVDRGTGDATELAVEGSFAGWRGPNRVVAVGNADGDGQPVLEITREGSVETIGKVQPYDPAFADLTPTLSPDGRELAWYESSGSGSADALLTMLTLSSGVRWQANCECVPGNQATWTPDNLQLVESITRGPDVFGTIPVAGPGPAIDPVVALSPRLDTTSMVTFAADVTTDGVPEPHSRWWYGWYIEWIIYTVASVALLVVMLLARHRRREDAGRRAYAEAFGRAP
jgi:hypothetical protein